MVMILMIASSSTDQSKLFKVPRTLSPNKQQRRSKWRLKRLSSKNKFQMLFKKPKLLWHSNNNRWTSQHLSFPWDLINNSRLLQPISTRGPLMLTKLTLWDQLLPSLVAITDPQQPPLQRQASQVKWRSQLWRRSNSSYQKSWVLQWAASSEARASPRLACARTSKLQLSALLKLWLWSLLLLQTLLQHLQQSPSLPTTWLNHSLASESKHDRSFIIQQDIQFLIRPLHT